MNSKFLRFKQLPSKKRIMPKGFVFDWFPCIYTEYCPILSQYSPMLSQSDDNWYIIISPGQLSWKGVYWFHSLLLCLVMIGQLRDGAFVPRSHCHSFFFINFQILNKKIGDMLCMVLLNIWWCHILESYCSNAWFVSWNILCSFHILTCKTCTVCIWDTIFDTKVYNTL